MKICFYIARSKKLITSLVILGLAHGLCACANTSYDRHNLSRLWVDPQSDSIFFDASTSAQYPSSSSDAEEIRKTWIAQWLKLRNLCADGYDITGRRDIERHEDNPHRHNLRYTLVCQ